MTTNPSRKLAFWLVVCIMLLVGWWALGAGVILYSVEHYENMALDKADTNKDGKIDITEAAEAYKTMRCRPENLFVDLDNTGVVIMIVRFINSKTEPVNGTDILFHDVTPFIFDMVRKIEYPNSINIRRSRVALLKKVADVNNDGLLTFEEVISMRKLFGLDTFNGPLKFDEYDLDVMGFGESIRGGFFPLDLIRNTKEYRYVTYNYFFSGL